jgi:hypothetical protein
MDLLIWPALQLPLYVAEPRQTRLGIDRIRGRSTAPQEFPLDRINLLTTWQNIE